MAMTHTLPAAHDAETQVISALLFDPALVQDVALNGPAEAAADYAERGWLVMPLHSIQGESCTCGKPDCHSPGKHPRTAHGLKDASTDQQQVAAWWREWPDANVGIVTGTESGIVVIDIDGQRGIASLDALEAARHRSARGASRWAEDPG
jgi:hypothetical protein